MTELSWNGTSVSQPMLEWEETALLLAAFTSR